LTAPDSSGAVPPASEQPDRVDPKDMGEEIDNALDVLGDLITGRRSVRGVLDEVLNKAFPERPKPEVAKDKPVLRAVDGGQK
jgi:hypothetical protein